MIILIPYSMRGFAVTLASGFGRLRLDSFSTVLYSTPEKLIIINIIQPIVIACAILAIFELIEFKVVRVSLFFQL